MELTPDTSYGFDVIEFARDVVGMPLDPWEEWCVIHGGELLADGRPRFRTLLILVARQNGKTTLAKVLILYWLFVEYRPLVLGTSTNRDYAKLAWKETVDLTLTNEWLGREVPDSGVREANGQECLTTLDGCEYRIAASNRRGGRSLTVHRLVLDELREHADWSAWNAATNAMNAVPDGQCVAITNQGDDTSVVLDSLRLSALRYLETGDGDPRLGLFEYSCPDGSEPDDINALAYSNPNLGLRIDADSLLGAGRRAKAAGGEELAGYQTEVMCMRVHLLNPAIDPMSWHDGGTDKPVALIPDHRNVVALCVDISLDGSHATLVAAAELDGLVHVEVLKAWSGFGCSKALRADLPDVVRRVKPRAIGWFPNGPAAAVAADLAKQRGPRPTWPPRGVTLVELKAEQTAVCMGLADLVVAGEVVHPNDPLLDAHVRSAQKLKRGDAWVFTRSGDVPVDATYALAGAVHLARTLPPPKAPLAIA